MKNWKWLPEAPSPSACNTHQANKSKEKVSWGLLTPPNPLQRIHKLHHGGLLAGPLENTSENWGDPFWELELQGDLCPGTRVHWRHSQGDFKKVSVRVPAAVAWQELPKPPPSRESLSEEGIPQHSPDAHVTWCYSKVNWERQAGGVLHMVFQWCLLTHTEGNQGQRTKNKGKSRVMYETREAEHQVGGPMAKGAVRR